MLLSMMPGQKWRCPRIRQHTYISPPSRLSSLLRQIRKGQISVTFAYANNGTNGARFLFLRLAGAPQSSGTAPAEA